MDGTLNSSEMINELKKEWVMQQNSGSPLLIQNSDALHSVVVVSVHLLTHISAAEHGSHFTLRC